MSPEERIIALEWELQDTRRAAVQMLLKLAQVVASSPEDRQDLAVTLVAIASGDPAMKRLACPVAEALHRGERMEQA